MAIKVKVKDKYDDVTFCSKHKCRKRTCFRHICHCSYMPFHSEADFEGKYYYCLKEYEKAKELLKNTMDKKKGDKVIMNNNIVIRCCPICGSKVKFTTKVNKYCNYDPCVEIFLECSNEDCGYLGEVRSFDDVEGGIESWNKVVHKFEQVRVGSQLKGRAEGEK